MLKLKRLVVKQTLLLTAFLFASGIVAFGQKMPLKTKDVSPITKDLIAKLEEIVKPAKDKVEAILTKDETGQYKAYQKDITRLNEIKDSKEKTALTKKIQQTYERFFDGVWKAAEINEQAYQKQIISVMPASLKNISFSKYLGISVTGSENTGTTTTPPPQPQDPPDQCLNVCNIATGEVVGNSKLISGGGGNYANCTARASSWAAATGMNELHTYLRNGISIPGTLPDDARKLHVTKRYDIYQEVTAFAVLGFSYAETAVRTYKTSEYLVVFAPVIFMANQSSRKTITEDYVIEKKDVEASQFRLMAGCFGYFVTGSWSVSEAYNIRWNICEQK